MHMKCNIHAKLDKILQNQKLKEKLTLKTLFNSLMGANKKTSFLQLSIFNMYFFGMNHWESKTI